MKKNNKGMSLVEVIVVIAIMAVLSGLITAGMGAVFSKPADECAEKIVSSMNATRVATMGRNSSSIRYYKNGDYIYCVETANGTPGTAVKIGEKGVNVTYTYKTGETYSLDSTPLTISFDRSNGSFQECEPGKYCEKIEVSKGSRTRTITLYNLTGKVSID